MCDVLGFSKMTGTCTTHIFAEMHQCEAAVKVKFCSQHTGHTTSLGHLRLSTERRADIAALLHRGVTISKIMDTMRSRVGESLQRDDLLCRLVEVRRH